MNTLKIKFLLLAVATVAVLPDYLSGHVGRRFDIEIINNKLYARGINTGGNDGLPSTRPYYNSIHDHFANLEDGTALAVFPELDLHDTADLLGSSMHMDLKDSFKWSNPPLMPPSNTIPTFESLDANETITLSYNNDSINSLQGGKLVLSNSIDPHGFFDLQIEHTIDLQPASTIYVLEWQLLTSATGISNSDSIFTMLSPAGATPEERLHHASLFLEQYLGAPSPVPEPGSTAILLALVSAAGFRRRRKR